MVSFNSLMTCITGEIGTASDNPSPAAMCQFKSQGTDTLSHINTHVYPTACVRFVGVLIPALRASPIIMSSMVIATA